MKLSKNLGRVATTFLATAMLASLTAVPAFAADNTGVIGDETADKEGKTAITEINVGKTITTDGKTYSPAGTYYIKVEEGEGGTFNDGTQTGLTALPGVPGAIDVTNPTSTVSGDLVNGSLPESFDITGGKLTIDASVFTAPGIYQYVVTEIDPNTDDNDATIPVEGMTYDTNSYNMYLYVMVNDAYDEEDPDSNPFYVGYVVTVDPDNTAEGVIQGKSELEFVNKYGTQEDKPELHDVTILKKVDGDQGDTDKLFKFNVQVNGEPGEQFVIEYQVSDDPKAPILNKTVTTGDTLEQSPIEITSTGYIKIYSLDATDTYTVTEQEATDYTTNIDTNYTDGETKEQADKKNVKTTGSLTMGNADNTVVFYNTKDAVTPTGIVMDIAPYALLVVVAAAGCFVFLRKRRED